MNRQRLLGWGIFLVAALIPLGASDYSLYLLTLMAAYGIVALGLNLLTGLSGQISLGHAGFFAIGAYVSSILASKYGVPFPIAAVIAVASGWFVGLLVGIPAVRLQGLYLAIATLAFGIGVERAIYSLKGLTGGPYGLVVDPPSAFGYAANSPTKLYYVVLVATTASILFISNVVHSNQGRKLIAMRDSELAAASMGVNVGADQGAHLRGQRRFGLARWVALCTRPRFHQRRAIHALAVDQFHIDGRGRGAWLGPRFIPGRRFRGARARVAARFRRILPDGLRAGDDPDLRVLAERAHRVR